MSRRQPIDPGYYPLLTEGMSDLAVRAAQGAIKRALGAKGIEANNLGNGAYGSLTRQDVNRLERAYGIRPVKGTNIGPATWRVLIPYLSKTNKRWLSRRRRQVIARNVKEAARRKLAEAKQRDPQVRIEKACERMWAARGHLRYTWTRPFNYTPERAWTYDCSGTVSVIYYLAGLPDPNGLGGKGFGYTGTLWPRGLWSPKPKVGDLAFYGYDRRGPFPSHVAIVISEALATKFGQRQGSGLHVLSYGSDPMRIALLRYRGDYRGCRSYV